MTTTTRCIDYSLNLIIADNAGCGFSAVFSVLQYIDIIMVISRATHVQSSVRLKLIRLNTMIAYFNHIIPHINLSALLYKDLITHLELISSIAIVYQYR